MNKRRIVLGVVVLVILLAVFYLWGPGKAPAGQPPLLTLSSASIGEFQRAFDKDVDVPRLVLMFSPT